MVPEAGRAVPVAAVRVGPVVPVKAVAAARGVKGVPGRAVSAEMVRKVVVLGVPEAEARVALADQVVDAVQVDPVAADLVVRADLVDKGRIPKECSTTRWNMMRTRTEN